MSDPLWKPNQEKVDQANLTAFIRQPRQHWPNVNDFSSLYPDFPVPVGVLRETTMPCYEDMLSDEVDYAVETRGPGDLRELLHSGDTWTVEG